MFTWVCPRCGRENSPSYSECPDCKERDLEAQAAAPVQQQHQPIQQPPAPTQEWHQPVQPQMYQQPQNPQFAPQPPAPQFAYAPPPPAPQQQPPQQPHQQYAAPTQPYAPPTYQQQQPPQQNQYAPPQPQHAQQPQYQQQYAPQQQPPQQQPQQYYAPSPVAPQPQSRTLPPIPPVAPRRAGLSALPVWLLMLMFAGAFLAAGAAVYYGYQKFGKGGPAGFTGGEQAATAAKPKATSPLQKYIEVVGIRLTSDAKKRPVAKFLVVNHASSEFNNVAGTVTLWASTSRSEEDAIGTFSFKIPAMGANEAKEVSELFKTKLKVYELPDWQFATAEVQITSQ